VGYQIQTIVLDLVTHRFSLTRKNVSVVNRRRFSFIRKNAFFAPSLFEKVIMKKAGDEGKECSDYIRGEHT
jgi:hypothetical protein